MYEFSRYVLVGGSAAIVNIGVLTILVEFCGLNFLLSNTCSFFAGLFVNYFLCKKFLFIKNTRIRKTHEFFLYVIFSLLSLAFDNFLLWLFTNIAGLFYVISKILSTAIAFWWNFLSRKLLNTMQERGNHGQP
jgi:putative flippase GtrA